MTSTICVHARVHTLKDGCLHTFWLTKTRLCVTLNLCHRICHIISHRCTRNNLPHHNFFNLQNLLTMQLLTYKDVSVTNCHIGGRVCVQHVTKFLMFYLERHVYTQMCRYETCSCACSCTKRRVCAHFLTCLCITFNICHHVCHQIFHTCIRNDVHPRNHVWEHWFDPHEGL